MTDAFSLPKVSRVRVAGVDLKQGEQLVRHLALHQHLLPVYRSPPPLPDDASTTLTSLLADISTYTSILPPSIHPSWRAHEQTASATSLTPSASSTDANNKNNKKNNNNNGGVPPGRAERKCAQLVALIRVLTPLVLALQHESEAGIGVVDFCAGCGHVGLLVAALFPKVRVTLVDVKKVALGIAKKRADAAQLTNVSYVNCAVSELPDDVPCDIAVGLHACGDASDDTLGVAAKRGAAVVIAPCCVGSLATPISSSHLGKSGWKYGNEAKSNLVTSSKKGALPSSIVSKLVVDEMDDVSTRVNMNFNVNVNAASDTKNDSSKSRAKGKALGSLVNTQEFGLLAQVADFGELATGKDQWRGIAKMILEKDRLVGMYEKGYSCTMLVKMRPADCTPKNDVLVAWPRGLSTEQEVAVMASWPVDQRANGYIDDFLDASVLTGFGANEVSAVGRMLREQVCDADSPGTYKSAPGGGNRARKLIHAVADAMNLVHESVGRGAARHVVVSRHVHWPVFFNGYVGIAGPNIDAMAKKLAVLVPDACIERKKMVRGEAHHLTLVGPCDINRVPQEFMKDRQALVKFMYQELVGSNFQIVGIGKVAYVDHKKQNQGGKGKTQGEDKEEKEQNEGELLEAYFAVVDWPHAQTLRKKLGLSRFNFHITLGFTKKDIHKFRKDSSTLIHSFNTSCYPWTS